MPATFQPTNAFSRANGRFTGDFAQNKLMFWPKQAAVPGETSRCFRTDGSFTNADAEKFFLFHFFRTFALQLKKTRIQT